MFEDGGQGYEVYRWAWARDGAFFGQGALVNCGVPLTF